MSRIEQAKSYAGQELETIFFRPMLSGPDAEKLGIRVMYNMPVPTVLHFWKREGDILQKYTAAGWNGGKPASKFQKTIRLAKVKAEAGYSAEDYFNMVYELITNRSEVNLDDLSGTELEAAETKLFREAIAESIRATMWLGDTQRDGELDTFDGFLRQIAADLGDGEEAVAGFRMPESENSGWAELVLRQLWNDAPRALRAVRPEGNLVFLVTSDVYAGYEEALDDMPLESAFLARQQGREGLMFRGIPVVDVQLSGYLERQKEMPRSFALLTDRRNLALAVNTSDFPGTEVRMWYNPDLMENRQRAVFMAGCDYLLPELVAFAFGSAELACDTKGVTATGGELSVELLSGRSLVAGVKAAGLDAEGNPAGEPVALTESDGIYTGTVAGEGIVRVQVSVEYVNGEVQKVTA